MKLSCFCIETPQPPHPLPNVPQRCNQGRMHAVSNLYTVLFLDVAECNSQVDALNTSVKWPVTCATITHRLMLVRPVEISSRRAQASL